MTPAERSLRARIAALQRHAQTDGREATAPMRAGFLARFEREVDPEGKLTPAVRARRAERALRAHMLKLAMKATAARQVKAAHVRQVRAGGRDA